MRIEKLALISGAVLVLSVSSVLAVDGGKPAAKSAAKLPVVNNTVLVEQETEQAVQAYQSGDFQKAAAHFKRVVELDPPNVKAWLFLGQSLAQSNDNMGARRAFAKVLALQSSGAVADRAIDQLTKLPEPNLFAMQLGSGMTLADWLTKAQQETAQGKREVVLSEIGQHLNQFGPVPQLLALQEKLQKEAQAEQEKRLKADIAAIKVSDSESAKIALPQIRQLKQQAPSNLALLQQEGRACHLLQDFECARIAYAAWIKVAQKDNQMRGKVAASLLQANAHQPVSVDDQSAWKAEYQIAEEDDRAWQGIKQEDYDSLNSYIKKYPNGQYIQYAKARVEQLYKEKVASRSFPATVPTSLHDALLTYPLFFSLPDSPELKCNLKSKTYLLHPSREGYLKLSRGQSGIINQSEWWERTSVAAEIRKEEVLTLGGLLTIRGAGFEINKIEEATGSMFPLRTGNKFNLAYSDTAARKRTLSCEVYNAVDETKIQPNLKGADFYRVSCEAKLSYDSKDHDSHYYYLCSNKLGVCPLSWEKSLGEAAPDFAGGFSGELWGGFGKSFICNTQ